MGISFFLNYNIIHAGIPRHKSLSKKNLPSSFESFQNLSGKELSDESPLPSNLSISKAEVSSWYAFKHPNTKQTVNILENEMLHGLFVCFFNYFLPLIFYNSAEKSWEI